MKNIALIGSTGSIGRQVLNAARSRPDLFKIVGLVANVPSEEYERQKAEFKPAYSALASVDGEGAAEIAELGCADVIFNAAVGFAGLEYSLRAVKAGKTLALANKETLVCGGEIIMPEAEARGAEIIPVDSEHSAIWQCLGFKRRAEVRRLIITASGGPFRGFTKEQLHNVTPEQALKHPTWKMGKKITIDSATLVNKGYEVIEAHMLYGTPYSRIQAVIQPQSMVHSMVEFEDGAILAQLSYPSMELPIRLALTYPERIPCAVPPTDFSKPFSLDFEPLDGKNFPLYAFALECGEEGGTKPCVLNAADEAAVGAFLARRIAFTDIFTVVERVVNAFEKQPVESFGQLKEIDALARKKAEAEISCIAELK